MEPAAPLPGLRPLHVICGAMAASVVLLGILSWAAPYLRVPPVEGLPPGLPPGLPLSLTMAAIVLIVLASRLRTGLLRRAAAPWAQAGPRAALEAYRRATVVSFALLEGAGVLGLVLALLTGSARNGLVLCAASLVAMLVRWPRAGELARLAGRRPGAPVPPTLPV
jgi:hypothetical protein